MLGKIIGIFFLIIIFSIPLYLLIGAGTMFIHFDKWHRKKQFKRGLVATPIAVVVGVICWPWILKAISNPKQPKQNYVEDVDLKQRAIDAVIIDRWAKKEFCQEWRRDYVTDIKIDPEETYSERVYS